MADGRAPLRRLLPEELDDDQRSVYEAITSGPRARGPQRLRLVDVDGRLEGPFNAFLMQPAIGNRLQALGSAIRFSTSLSDRAREIAILAVAAHWQSEFEQYAHEAIGRSVGLSGDELDALRAGADRSVDVPAHAVWTDPSERLLLRVVQSSVREGDIGDDTYASALDVFGEAGLFEVLTLVGYYATLALQLRVFRVALPASGEAHH
jgi:4-carboxymuconolactone decarboxylase